MNVIDFYFQLLKEPKKFSLNNYAYITLSGSDVETFLHNQTTNDVYKLENYNFQSSTMLSNKGILETAFLLLKEVNSFSILVEKKYLDKTLKRLNQFLISEDVEIKVEDNHQFNFVFGLTQLENSFSGIFLGENGFLTQQSNSYTETNDLNVLKVLSGYPELSDIKENSLLNNSSILHFAYDDSKGCFPGNETVSKIESRKGAGFKDVLLFLSHCEDELELGTSLRVDGKKVGSVIDFKKIENGVILKADLLREYRVENKLITFDDLSVSATVYNLPFYDWSQKHIYFYDRAIELFQDSKDEEAIEYFNLAIKFKADFADAYESLAVLLGRLERFQEAIELLDQLVIVDPKSVMAHTNLSMYHMKLGHIEIAEQHKSEATIKSFAMHGEAAEQKRAQEEQEKADLEEELRKEGMFRQVLDIDEDDSLANYGLGEIHFRRKEFDHAQKHLEKVLNNDPKYSVGYLLLGKILLSQGKKDEAHEIFEKGIEVAAKNGDMMPANEMQRLIQN